MSSLDFRDNNTKEEVMIFVNDFKANIGIATLYEKACKELKHRCSHARRSKYLIID